MKERGRNLFVVRTTGDDEDFGWLLGRGLACRADAAPSRVRKACSSYSQEDHAPRISIQARPRSLALI